MLLLILLSILLSILGFLASAVLHFSTYFGDPQDHWPHWWLVFFGVVIIPFLSFRLILKKHRTPENPNPNLKNLIPLWIKPPFQVLIIYVLLTVFFCMFHIRSRNLPTRFPDGTYGIQVRAQIYPLTEQEYHYQRALSVRCFTAVWLLFFASPLPFFLS